MAAVSPGETPEQGEINENPMVMVVGCAPLWFCRSPLTLYRSLTCALLHGILQVLFLEHG